MGDVLPDYHVEQYRIVAQMAQLRMTKHRQRLEIVEMESRKRKSKENIDATDLALLECEDRLKGLIAEHGKADGLEDA